MKRLLYILAFINIPVVFGQDFNGVNSSQIDSISSKSFPKTNLNGDSILTNYSKSIHELFESPIDFNQDIPNKDSLINKRKLIPSINGQINAGYEYGLLTGYFDSETTDPLRVFNTNGDLQLELLKLPMNVSYNYSTFRNPLGVNNYFRFSLDTEKLKQNAAAKKNETIGSIDSSLKKVEDGKSLVQGKLGMGEVLMQKMKRELANQEKGIKETQKKLASETTNNSIENALTIENTLADSVSLKDSISAINSNQSTQFNKIDSLTALYQQQQQNYEKGLLIYDSIQKLYNKALALYTTYSDFQQQLNEKKSILNGIQSINAEDIANEKINTKKESLLSCIETFDLGLTYPQTSALTKNSAPIQGINIELNRKNWYYSLSAGVMMNNLMVSTDIVQNKLSNTSNLFNQFDFQNVQERGFLTSIKTGYGTKEGTHYFVGVRYLTNSFSSLSGLEDSTSTPSLGTELDIRLAPIQLPNTTMDFVYGKTSLSNSLEANDNNVVRSLFSSHRTNTGLVKITQNFPKVRSEISLSTRLIDPFADVRSFGAMQPDNLRYEIKTTHKLKSNLRIGFNYRNDQNNIANLSDSSISLTLLGTQLNGSVGSSFHYFGSINYLTQLSQNSATRSKTTNYMGGAGISFEYKLFETEHSSTISYNDFLITDPVSTGSFRTIGIQNLSKLSFGQNTFSLSYFESNDEQISAFTSVIVGNEITYQSNKIQLTGGLKIAFSEAYGNDTGAKIEIGYRLTKSLLLSVKAEKLVLGDFYNYYSRDRFDRFPYMILTKISWLF